MGLPKVHPRVIFTGASTMRLASSGPNIQNCFDSKTDVLTGRGWVRFIDLKEDDVVAQWDNGKITFVQPLDYISYNYTGKMVGLYNEHINMRVTANHRCLVRQRKTNVYKVVDAIDYPEDYIQLHAGMWDGGDGVDLTDDELRYLIATQADGSYNKGTTSASFSFYKERKVLRLEEILKNCGFRYSKSNNDKRGRTRFNVWEPLSRRYLTEEKTFQQWMFDLSRKQIDLVLDEIMYWDGLFKLRTCYSSGKSQNIDIISALYALSNTRTLARDYFNKDGGYCKNLYVTYRNFSMTTNISKEIEEVIDEPVYCVAVPSAFIVVRREGRVQITGNCPARGWGKQVKKIFIPPPGKIWCSSDASNLETRIVLDNAGIDSRTIERDAFTWLVNQDPSGFEMAGKIAGKSARDMAKITSHSTNYLAGLKLFDEYEIRTPYVQKLVKMGALEIYEDWHYCGKVVGFTGIRLAEILFKLRKNTPKEEALELRKKALLVTKVYCDKFPIRQWQREVMAQAEKGFIQTRWGSYLTLIESPTENAKIAAAKIGQGEGAEYVQGKQLELLRSVCNEDVTMDAQVHDEILLSIPRDYPERKIRDIIDILHGESHRLKGFYCPWVAKKGVNWGELEKIPYEGGF